MTGYSVVARTQHLRGNVFSVVTDTIQMPDGAVADRDYVRDHLGAIAVVPYDPASDQVLLIRQYRHPVGRELWELPAGLRDVVGEEPVATAARELAEEADLAADEYRVLVDLAVSPGSSDEVVRVFLACGLSEVPLEQRHVRQHEEATMTKQWFPLDTAVAMCLAGEIENATCVAGLLATAHAREHLSKLRGSAAPWLAVNPADEA